MEPPALAGDLVKVDEYDEALKWSGNIFNSLDTVSSANSLAPLSKGDIGLVIMGPRVPPWSTDGFYLVITGGLIGWVSATILSRI